MLVGFEKEANTLCTSGRGFARSKSTNASTSPSPVRWRWSSAAGLRSTARSTAAPCSRPPAPEERAPVAGWRKAADGSHGDGYADSGGGDGGYGSGQGRRQSGRL